MTVVGGSGPSWGNWLKFQQNGIDPSATGILDA
jgi:hypothetical protein